MRNILLYHTTLVFMAHVYDLFEFVRIKAIVTLIRTQLVLFSFQKKFKFI